MLTEHCIYTIRHSSDLEKSYADGGSDEYEERRNWKTGRRLLEEARSAGKALPIIFAPAEGTRRLFGWALIDDIIPGPTTTYSFSRLQLFQEPPAKTTLRKADDGKRLDKWFIRPYAICRTPAYLDDALPVRARRYWTFHWRNQYWRDEVNAEFEPVCSSGSNNFRKRGVSVGDVVYVISLVDGHLLLGGRMTVKRIVSRREAVRIWGTNRLYGADEWIIDEEQAGTLLHLHWRLAHTVSKQLRFLSPGGEEKRLFFVSDSHLDAQSTRGVRELSSASATLLDEIIEVTDQLPAFDGMMTVTEDLLRAAEDESRTPQIRLAEEIPTSSSYDEGEVQRVLVNRYERDPRARGECISRHGTACSVCGFDFVATYGDVMAGFIHVHHLKPLSNVGGGYRVNPAEDLRPICPNCHAVVHRKDPPYSLDEVRQFLKNGNARSALIE